MAAAAVFTAVDWHQLNRLLEKALELDPPQRATWVEQQTDLKPELASALRELLAKAASEEDDDEFASPFAATLKAGDLVGPYRLVRELAQGGMGVVWVAERADGSFERQVALKLPRPEWAAPGLAERMARERAILASLNHPNIAQLYDAGWTSDGRPFLALEFVEGVPIDSFFATHTLGVRDRLRLFVDVVRAVAFAHTRLIVHRDLKPANVLVTADGNVKLLDFGISKLTRGEQTGAETALTRVSGRALTLAYAAPEQVLGQPVSPATDVYALGVMLYELLTGTRPYRPKHDSKLALEEAVLHAEPLPPSKAVASQRANELKGDLDTIILKALKKAPAQRYATASEFADDLEAFLAQHPVKARPDSRLYRARLFVRRNRLALGVTSALAATLLIGGGVALWQAQATKAEAQRADAIKEFVLAMLRQADPLADSAQRERDDSLLSIAEERITTELTSRPEMAMELRLTIAEAYRNRGFYDRTLKVLQTAKEEGARTLPDNHRLMTTVRVKMGYAPIVSEETEVELDKAIDHARSMGPDGIDLLVEGLLRRSFLLASVDPEPSMQQLTEAFDLAREHLGLGHPLTLEAAIYFSPRSRSPEVLERALEAARRNPKLSPTHPMILKAQAIRGRQLVAAGQPDEGLKLAVDAVEASRNTHGDQGKITEENLQILASVLYAAGQPRNGLEAQREAYRLASLREGPSSPNRHNVGRNLARSLLTYRQLQELAPFIDENVRFEIDHFGKASPDSRSASARIARNVKADIQFFDAWYLLEDGRTAEAEERLGAILQTSALPPGRAGDIRAQLARAKLENDRPAEAIEVLMPLKNRPWGVVAAARLALGNPSEALLATEQGTKSGRDPGFTNPPIADFFIVNGRALLALGRPSEAIAAIERAYVFWRSFDPASPWAAEAAYWYGRALVAAGRTDEGRPLICDAIPMLRKSQMPSHRKLAAASS